MDAACFTACFRPPPPCQLGSPSHSPFSPSCVRRPDPAHPMEQPALALLRPAVVHMVASCRRERIIERASKQRMERRAASYKAAADAAAAAAAENSRWRQNYSDRMAVRV